MLTAPRLQRSNPLTSGLLWAIAGGHPFDLVSGRQGTTAGGATTLNGTSIHGGAFESTVTNGTNNISWPDYRITRITTAHSIMAIVDIDTRVDDAEVVQVPYSGGVVSPYSSLSFGDDGAGAPIGRMTVGTATVATYTPGGTLWQTGHHAYAWTRYGANQAFYRDGVLFASTSGGSTGTVDFGGAATEIDIYGFSVANPLHSVDGRTTFAGIWDRALTAGEVAILTQNPSQLWMPKRSVAFPVVLLPPAAGATNVTPTVVAVTFTIPTPTLTMSASIATTAVAATFTIPAPTITASASITVTAVAQAWTIPTPAITAGTSIAMTALAATFVIPTPTLTATASIAVTAVASSWTIPTPSVTTGSDTSIGATMLAGTFTIPTPAIAGTQVATTAPAQTWTIPTPVVSTPTNVAVTRVQLVAVVGTSAPSNLTNVTPTALPMLCAVPTPTRTASATIAAAAVVLVYVINNVGLPGAISLFGGNATGTSTLVYGSTSTTAGVGGSTSTTTAQGSTTTLNP